MIFNKFLDLGNVDQEKSKDYFSRIFYGYSLICFLMLLPYEKDIWSKSALISSSDRGASFFFFDFNLVDLILNFRFVFYVIYTIFFVCSILKPVPILSALFVYIFNITLNQLNMVISDGGTNLAHLLSIYLIFVSASGISFKGKFAALNYFFNSLSNVFWFICKWQICVMYLTAGLYKMNGSMWQSGMSIYYVLQSDDFGLPSFFTPLFVSYPIVPVVANYITMAFQYSFPLLIWNKKLKPILIFVGVSLHLSIMYFMGLFSFGLIMCLSYLLFVDDNFWQQIEKTIKKILANLKVIYEKRKGMYV